MTYQALDFERLELFVCSPDLFKAVVGTSLVRIVERERHQMCISGGRQTVSKRASHDTWVAVVGNTPPRPEISADDFSMCFHTEIDLAFGGGKHFASRERRIEGDIIERVQGR